MALFIAKPFNTVDAKRVIEEQKQTIEKLKNAQDSVKQNEEAIRKASEALVAQEVLKVLQDIPIEEINRDKRGFRVRSLREHGFNTIADIATAPVFSIASVYGISSDSAYSIKRIVNDITSKARQGIKIKLSTDNKTKEATKLVLLISKYLRSEPIIEECHKLLMGNEKKVTYALEDLTAVIGGFKWVFASKSKKQTVFSLHICRLLLLPPNRA